MAKLQSPVMLVILDGFGIGELSDPTNAVAQAQPKNFTLLQEMYPTTTLNASGLDVGLPAGQMGNSEVGHLNLGAGRIVYQELTRITKDANEGELFKKPILVEAYKHAEGKRLHILGLLSDGGVHSHIDHIKGLLRGAKEADFKEVYIHAFLDGRDVPPSSASQYIVDLEGFMDRLGLGKIATIGGRYYGMDRDKRWEREEIAYKAIVDGEGLYFESALDALKAAYERNETDEFVLPSVICKEGQIEHGDTVIFANFRPDRARQLTAALCVKDFDGFDRKKGLLQIYMATMTKYEDSLPAHVIYEKEPLKNTLGEVLSKHGLKQLRIAETEKYAHVTYFFNGGAEDLFDGEDRILVPSPKVATYDLQPEMSAYEVADKVIEAIQKGRYDMIILNFANPDMVGHTGVFEAAVKAVKTVDECLGKIVKEIVKVNGHLLVTADHGNCDIMVDHATNIPHTAHTTNPVPLILVSEQYKDAKLSHGRLCDIAPTMLDLAKIEKPAEMTGTSLIINNN